jgi:hypothetical protein
MPNEQIDVAALNLSLAAALGLDVKNLAAVDLALRPDALPKLTAVYNVLDSGPFHTHTRSFTLTEMKG